MPGWEPTLDQGGLSVQFCQPRYVLPLRGRAVLGVRVIACAVGERRAFKKKRMDRLAFTVGVKSAFQLPRLN